MLTCNCCKKVLKCPNKNEEARTFALTVDDVPIFLLDTVCDDCTDKLLAAVQRTIRVLQVSGV